MSQTPEILLDFPCRVPGRGTPVKFTNVEEFFETLGILCRDDLSTAIKGNTNTNQPRTQPDIGSVTDWYTAGLITILERSRLPFRQTSFFIECSDTVYYPKTFHDIFKEKKSFKISCSSYVCYLFEKGFAEETIIPGRNDTEVVSLKASHPSKVEAAMKENGYEKYVYFFRKGLAAPNITPDE